MVNAHAASVDRMASLFFDEVCRKLGRRSDVKIIVVAHVLSSLPPFLEALQQLGDVACLIPKPKSSRQPFLRLAESRTEILELQRHDFANPQFIVQTLRSRVGSKRFVTVDIGGYFAPVANALGGSFRGQYLGSVEDTENGHQKYERAKVRVPCLSVARSLAKRTEDKHVGHAIVFSTESILLPLGVPLQSRTVLVIGYGKIGQSIAATLHAKRARVLVADRDPCQLTLADSDGFEVVDKIHGLAEADIIFCATGNRSIAGTEWSGVRSDSYVASATSADDEFDLSCLRRAYARLDRSENVATFAHRDHRIHLLAGGNAVNFVHGAEVRPYVYLVQATLLVAIDRLVRGSSVRRGLSLITKEMEQFLHAQFLASFRGLQSQSHRRFGASA